MTWADSLGVAAFPDAWVEGQAADLKDRSHLRACVRPSFWVPSPILSPPLVWQEAFLDP